MGSGRPPKVCMPLTDTRNTVDATDRDGEETHLLSERCKHVWTLRRTGTENVIFCRLCGAPYPF